MYVISSTKNRALLFKVGSITITKYKDSEFFKGFTITFFYINCNLMFFKESICIRWIFIICNLCRFCTYNELMMQCLVSKLWNIHLLKVLKCVVVMSCKCRQACHYRIPQYNSGENKKIHLLRNITFHKFPLLCSILQKASYSDNIILTISLSVSRIPSFPKIPTFCIVFSTPLETMPSPALNS